MQKKSAFFVYLCAYFFSYTTWANNELIFVNHLENTLYFFAGINPDVLIDVPQNFILSPNAEIKTRIMDNNKEVYIRAEDKNDNSAFFGVAIADHKIIIYGYIANEIAYSWSEGKLIFCPIITYQKKDSC